MANTKDFNEPVAWIVAHTDGSAPPPYIVNHEPFYKNDSRTKVTPLYTHPAQPLSYETVRAEFRSYVDNNLDVDDGFRFVDFLEGVRYAEKAHHIGE